MDREAVVGEGSVIDGTVVGAGKDCSAVVGDSTGAAKAVLSRTVKTDRKSVNLMIASWQGGNNVVGSRSRSSGSPMIYIQYHRIYTQRSGVDISSLLTAYILYRSRTAKCNMPRFCQH